ncbi:MAG: methyltransferase [Herpetosiphonaceae bacterium]|nr:MAG: methyltransferase [Herpetosiphonaceae bacterium]
MRIITGQAKGRKLKGPPDHGTRPMLDRVKESLFSILEGYDAIHGRVLDLYAGTGALGIECLSRGAEWADFVEQRGAVAKVIRENLRLTRMEQRAHIYTMSVERFLHSGLAKAKYAIILMDPPYADPAIEKTIGMVAEAQLLEEEGLLVVGHWPRLTLVERYGPLVQIKSRRLGDSCFTIFEQESTITTSPPEHKV